MAWQTFNFNFIRVNFFCILEHENEKKSIGNAPANYSECVVVPAFNEVYIKKGSYANQLGFIYTERKLIFAFDLCRCSV